MNLNIETNYKYLFGMLHQLLSLVLFLLITEGKSEIKASPLGSSIFNSRQENSCDEYVIVDFLTKNPLIYKKKNIKKGTLICINSSNIYMSIIFHSWKNFEARTLRTFYKPTKPVNTSHEAFKTEKNPNPEFYISNTKVENYQTNLNLEVNESGNDTNIIEDGPYREDDDSIIGFYFGRNIGQIQLRALKNNADLSFGLIIFNEMSTLRIISNNKEDTLKFTDHRNSNIYGCHRHVQYFNGLPGSQSYSIEMSIDENEDYLNFRNSQKCSMNYTGELSIQKQTTEEEPQILNFFTNYNNKIKDPSNNSTKDKKLEVYLRIEENSNFVKSKKYGRIWTSSGKYSTIPAFSYSECSVGWVILTVVLCVVFVVALIAFIIIKKRKARYVKCNDTIEEGIDSNIENDGQTHKSTKVKRRMLFESVVSALHSPQNKKNDSIDSNQQKNHEGIDINQDNLLSKEDEN